MARPIPEAPAEITATGCSDKALSPTQLGPIVCPSPPICGYFFLYGSGAGVPSGEHQRKTGLTAGQWSFWVSVRSQRTAYQGRLWPRGSACIDRSKPYPAGHRVMTRDRDTTSRVGDIPGSTAMVSVKLNRFTRGELAVLGGHPVVNAGTELNTKGSRGGHWPTSSGLSSGVLR